VVPLGIVLADSFLCDVQRPFLFIAINYQKRAVALMLEYRHRLISLCWVGARQP